MGLLFKYLNVTSTRKGCIFHSATSSAQLACSFTLYFVTLTTSIAVSMITLHMDFAEAEQCRQRCYKLDGDMVEYTLHVYTCQAEHTLSQNFLKATLTTTHQQLACSWSVCHLQHSLEVHVALQRLLDCLLTKHGI